MLSHFRDGFISNVYGGALLDIDYVMCSDPLTFGVVGVVVVFTPQGPVAFPVVFDQVNFHSVGVGPQVDVGRTYMGVHRPMLCKCLPLQMIELGCSSQKNCNCLGDTQKYEVRSNT